MTDWTNPRSANGRWGEEGEDPPPRVRVSRWGGASPEKVARPGQSSGGPASGSRVKKCPFFELIPPVQDSVVGERVLQNVMQLWVLSKEKRGVREALAEAYRTAKNPYSLGLFLMVKSGDFLHLPTKEKELALSVVVIQELEKYVTSCPNPPSLSDPKIQIAAVRLAVKQRSKNMDSLLLRVYKLQEIEKEVIQFIRELVQNREFEEACLLATATRIDCFDIQEFLTPLFFQDSLVLIEEYLETSKSLQDRLVAFVDGFLYHGADVDANLARYRTENNISLNPKQRSRWSEKSLKKLVKKWINRFGNPSAAPNVQQSVNCGQIKFLTGQRYESECLAEPNFLELIAGVIRTDTTSTAAEYAFRSILNYGDTAAAVKLVKEHNIDISNTPEYIRSIVDRGLEPQTSASSAPAECWEEEDWDTGETIARQTGRNSNETHEGSAMDRIGGAIEVPTVYSLPIPLANVVVVANESDVKQFRDYIHNRLKYEEMLESGFDCEWKSIKPDCAALLQVSFTGMVYLIDLISLKNLESSETAFGVLTQAYFSNSNVLKLGYDYVNDISMLSKVHKTWANLKLLLRNIIDLRVLKSKIRKKAPYVLQTILNSDESKEGLSEFVFQCFGKVLSKEEQISDWERRPLRQSQVTYAAADCYCLLELFLFLKNKDSESHFGFTELWRG